jgi:hypothetical protein
MKPDIRIRQVSLNPYSLRRRWVYQQALNWMGDVPPRRVRKVVQSACRDDGAVSRTTQETTLRQPTEALLGDFVFALFSS